MRKENLMKKIYWILLSMALLFSLAACGGSESSSSEASTSSPETSSQSVAESSDQPVALEEISDSPEPAESENLSGSGESGASADAGGMLIAYFSWSGNTEQMAQTIQAETGGDLFRIEPAMPYTDDYDTLLDIAQQEQADNARPELAAQVENWDSYDVIFVGYPNWWSDAPMAVYTFLESYDFTDKTLIPFNTSASGGFGRSLSGIEESAAGAVILEGLALTEGELGGVQSEVSSWLAGMNLE